MSLEGILAKMDELGISYKDNGERKELRPGVFLGSYTIDTSGVSEDKRDEFFAYVAQEMENNAVL